MCYNRYMAKDAVLNVRLPADVKQALLEAASADDRSASSLSTDEVGTSAASDEADAYAFLEVVAACSKDEAAPL